MILEPSGKKILGINLIAFFETIVFLGVLLILNFLFGNGDRYINYEINPFWAIILLVSVQYGVVEGIMAVVLSTFALYLFNLPPQTINETTYEYEIKLAFLPCLWLITAYILGSIRSRKDLENFDLKNALARVQQEVNTITNAYLEQKKVKENAEVNLARQNRTLASIYSTFKSLESSEAPDVIKGSAEVLRSFLNPKKFSLFVITPGGAECLSATGWEKEDSYQRLFLADSPLYQEVVVKKRLLSVINENDIKTLNGQGILVAPLVDYHNNESFGFLKIEQLEVYKLNFSTIEAFKSICELVGMAYANAREYKVSKVREVYDEKMQVYTHYFYPRQESYLKNLAKEANIPLSKILIKYKIPEHIILDPKFDIRKETISVLNQTLPPKKELFLGRTNREFEVLLPDSYYSEANLIVAKVYDAIYKSLSLKTMDWEVEAKQLFPEELE